MIIEIDFVMRNLFLKIGVGLVIKTTFGLSSVKVYATFSRVFKIELEWVKNLNELKI